MLAGQHCAKHRVKNIGRCCRGPHDLWYCLSRGALQGVRSSAIVRLSALPASRQRQCCHRRLQSFEGLLWVASACPQHVVCPAAECPASAVAPPHPEGGKKLSLHGSRDVRYDSNSRVLGAAFWYMLKSQASPGCKSPDLAPAPAEPRSDDAAALSPPHQPLPPAASREPPGLTPRPLPGQWHRPPVGDDKM